MMKCSQYFVLVHSSEWLNLKSELQTFEVEMEGYLKELGYGA
jgi:hypothetical protein